MQEGSLVNYYQPIIDLRTEEAIGVELLLRWPTNPVMNSPATFIPMAEELGLIVELTLTALDDAFENLTQWRRYQPNFSLSLNVSPTHFNDDSFYKDKKINSGSRTHRKTYTDNWGRFTLEDKISIQ